MCRWISELDLVGDTAGVVVLRLFRLLRVFRAARGWPELQSIVSALFAGTTRWYCFGKFEK